MEVLKLFIESRDGIQVNQDYLVNINRFKTAREETQDFIYRLEKNRISKWKSSTPYSSLKTLIQNYADEKSVPVTVLERNGVLVNSDLNLAVDDIIYAYEISPTQTLVFYEEGTVVKYLVQSSLDDLIDDINNIPGAGGTGSIDSQNHTVTAGEEGSGVISGLTAIGTLVKVEDIDGTVIKFTLDSPNQISTVENIYEDQILIIWYKQ